MTKRDPGGAGHEDAQIGGSGQQHHLHRIDRIRGMEIGQRGKEIGTGKGDPDAGLAEQRGDREDDDGQQPCLAPAFGQPLC